MLTDDEAFSYSRRSKRILIVPFKHVDANTDYRMCKSCAKAAADGRDSRHGATRPF